MKGGDFTTLNKTINIQVGGAGRTFYPVPADKYTVQIADVNEEPSAFDADKTVLNIEFTILDNKNFDYKNEEGQKEIESTRGRKLWKRMTPVLTDGSKGKASNLYKLCCAIEKKAEPAEFFEDMAKNPDALIGQQVGVMVNTLPGKDGRIWNNILDFTKIDKELNPFDASSKEQLEEVDTEELDKVLAS